MPRLFTLGNLVSLCAKRCDLENHSAFPAAEWKGMISTQYAELFGLVAETGLRYFETTETIIADGSASYVEPSAMLSTVGVDHIVNAAGERRPLVELMAQERHYYAGKTGEAYGYMLVDDRLFLMPKPTTGTYEWLYVPQPPDLSEEEDDFNIDVVTPDGEAFLLWGVAVQALAKEGSDPSLARAEREAARERITSWAIMRALHAPRRPMGGDEYVLRDPADWRYF